MAATRRTLGEIGGEDHEQVRVVGARHIRNGWARPEFDDILARVAREARAADVDDVARGAARRVDGANEWRRLDGVLDRAVPRADGVDDGELEGVVGTAVGCKVLWDGVAELRSEGVGWRLADVLALVEGGLGIIVLGEVREEGWDAARKARRVRIGRLRHAAQVGASSVHGAALVSATRPAELGHVVHVACARAAHAALGLLAIRRDHLLGCLGERVLGARRRAVAVAAAALVAERERGVRVEVVDAEGEASAHRVLHGHALAPGGCAELKHRAVVTVAPEILHLAADAVELHDGPWRRVQGGAEQGRCALGVQSDELGGPRGGGARPIVRHRRQEAEAHAVDRHVCATVRESRRRRDARHVDEELEAERAR